jgi:hypothetical protein
MTNVQLKRKEQTIGGLDTLDRRADGASGIGSGGDLSG